jgi:glycosyltransferase involved in cell wall biosynthesis
MAWKVWFVPAQPNHVAKFKPLKDAMRARGCDVHTLCVDIAIPPRMRIEPLLQATGEPFEMMPPCGFRPFKRWPFEYVQKRRLNRAVQRWLDSHEADLLVFGTVSPIVTREFLKEAQKRRIPRMHMQDGLCVGPNPRLKKKTVLTRIHEVVSDWLTTLTDMRLLRDERSADLVFVMDQSSPPTLLRYGVPPERIRVVGSPEYDALARQVEKGPSETELRRWREMIGAPPDRPLVLYAHQHTTRTREVKGVIRTLVAAVRRCGGTLLVKFHPSTGGSLETWRQWAAGEGMSSTDTVFLMKELLSLEALQLCDACVTSYSTVTLEAMLCRKPVILIQYLTVLVSLTYGEKYGVPEAFTPQQLEAHVVEVLTNPEVRRRVVQCGTDCISKELLGLDGKSTERMADSIIDLIERRRWSTA